jgi:hypothetical protein
VQRKPTNEEGELLLAPNARDPACETLYFVACGKYVTSNGALDEERKAQGFHDCEKPRRFHVRVNETEKFPSAVLILNCHQFVEYAVNPATLLD